MDLLAIKNRLVNRGIASSLESQIYDWINDAYMEIWNAYDWNFKYTTATLTYSSSTATYAISTSIGTDVDSIQFILDSNGDMLERKSLYQLKTQRATTGSPLRYAEVGTNIILDPVPTASGTLTVYYQKALTTLVNSTDTPLIPTNWQGVLVELAYAKALLYDDDSRTITVFNLANKMLRDMKVSQNMNVDEVSRFGIIKPSTGQVY
jgi:hypothetical protein